MEHLRGHLAVVTGASSGIGSCIVRELLAAGLVVVGLARRLDRLNDLRQQLPSAQQDHLHVLHCDVSDANSVAESFTKISENHGQISILVNNAGCLHSGQLCRLPAEQVRLMLETNLMGVVNCIRHAFAGAIEASEPATGHIILINSILGHHVATIPGHLPALNIYPATKHALTAMNEIYRQEFMALGAHIKVTSISPGLVDTEFITEEQKRSFRDKILRPEDVARAVMFALSQPPHVLVYELTIKPMGEVI